STANACTDGTWATQAKASNGNVVFGGPSKSGGLTSLVANSCQLTFQHEPAPALPNKTITDTAYTPSGNGVNSVTVGPATALPVPRNGGTVSLQATSGSFDNGGAFSGTSVAFSGGSAAFPTLAANDTGGPFTLTASADGFSSVDSAPPFAITLN